MQLCSGYLTVLINVMFLNGSLVKDFSFFTTRSGYLPVSQATLKCQKFFNVVYNKCWRCF